MDIIIQLKESKPCVVWLKRTANSRLFFGGAGGRDVSIHNIEVFEEQIRKDLIVLKRYQETLEKAIEVEDHVYYLLTTSFGIETYEAYLRWCAKAKKMLNNYYKT